MNRGGYWKWWLICVVFNFVMGFVAGMIKLPILGQLVGLVVSVFLVIQGIKRMHDVDKSGWFLLIPIYNLILLLTTGTPGPNTYGDPPQS